MRTSTTALLLIVISVVTKPIGFVKEIVVAAIFGAGVSRDAFLVALQVPSLVGSLVIEGLPQVLVPFIAAERRKPGAAPVLGGVLALLALVFVAVSVVLAAFPAPWVSWVAPFLDAEARTLAAELLRILSFSVFFLGLAAFWTGLLFARGNVILPSLAVPVQSAVILVSVAVAGARFGIHALAWGTLFGTVAMVVLLLPALRETGSRPSWHLGDGARRFLRLGGGFFAGTLVFGLLSVAEKILASRLPAGSISCLDYAARITQLAFTVLGSITLGVFPRLCAQASNPDGGREFGSLLVRTMRAVLFLALPAAAFFAVFRREIVGLVYERGAFDPAASLTTADLLGWYAAGLVPHCLNHVLVHGFYARREMGIRVQYALVILAVYVATSLALVGRWGVPALAVANGAAAAAGTVFLGVTMRRQAQVALRTLAAPSFVTAILAVAAVGAAWFLGRRLAPAASPLPTLCLAGSVASGIFLGLALVLRVRELRDVISTLANAVQRWKT